MRGHNTMSLLLIIFSDFVTLKSMHQVLEVLSPFQQTPHDVTQWAFKTQVNSFHSHTQTQTFLNCCQCLVAPRPSNPQPPSKNISTPISIRRDYQFTPPRKKGGDFWGKDNWGPQEGSHLNYGTCSRSDPPQQKGPQLLALRDLEQRVDPRSEPQQQRATTGHGCQALSPCWGESGAAVTCPDGEEQNGVSLPLAGPAEVMGRGRGWAHRHGRGKQSRQQECSWKQAQTQNM